MGRARVRHVKLRKEQRIVEKELQDERNKLFGTYSERQRVAKIHPLADKFHFGEKRKINLKEARKETMARYNKLPEVIEAKRPKSSTAKKLKIKSKQKFTIAKFNRKS